MRGDRRQSRYHFTGIPVATCNLQMNHTPALVGMNWYQLAAPSAAK
jgi:hypothetical protein